MKKFETPKAKVEKLVKLLLETLHVNNATRQEAFDASMSLFVTICANSSVTVEQFSDLTESLWLSYPDYLKQA